MSKIKIALGVVAVGSVLTMLGSPRVVDAAADKVVRVFVSNDDANPVPTRAIGTTAVAGTVAIDGTPNVNVTNFPAPAPAPLWRGTPYASSRILLNATSYRCDALDPIPAGMVLFAERAIVAFNVPAGQHGSALVAITPLGSGTKSLAVPVSPGPPVDQVRGIYDGYAGAVDLGIPLTSVEACLYGGGTGANGDITVLGYLVPAP
jgi:hypothetical protein